MVHYMLVDKYRVYVRHADFTAKHDHKLILNTILKGKLFAIKVQN